MKEWVLRYQDKAFIPQMLRGALNTGAVFEEDELAAIRREAFPENKLLQQSSALVLPKMFASGMCTGMSAWTLLRFAQQTEGLEEWHHSAVLQARILRASVWRRVLADYAADAETVLDRLLENLTAEEACDFPMLMIVPRMGNLLQLAHAHALVPYRASAQGNLYQISVYDCNAPGDPQRVVKWDRLSGCWKYNQFHSGQWFISSLALKLLTSANGEAS